MNKLELCRQLNNTRILVDQPSPRRGRACKTERKIDNPVSQLNTAKHKIVNEQTHVTTMNFTRMGRSIAEQMQEVGLNKHKQIRSGIENAQDKLESKTNSQPATQPKQKHKRTTLRAYLCCSALLLCFDFLCSISFGSEREPIKTAHVLRAPMNPTTLSNAFRCVHN